VACQALAQPIHSFDDRAALTRRRIRETKQHIRRIEAAKGLVCGTPSIAAIAKLRHDFEALLPMLREGCEVINSGGLDDMSDDQLKEVVAFLQQNDLKMSAIYDGSLRIGLGAIEGFPPLLDQFKNYQSRLRSQMEGILLSLNDSFQDLLEQSAQEITIPA
jgi:hypothetical protein